MKQQILQVTALKIKLPGKMLKGTIKVFFKKQKQFKKKKLTVITDVNKMNVLKFAASKKCSISLAKISN